MRHRSHHADSCMFGFSRLTSEYAIVHIRISAH